MNNELIKTESDKEAIAQGCYFDESKAEKAIAWITSNLHVKLYQWQRDILWQYFGWRNKSGGYRFSKIQIWIPKKNGKSYLISALLAYKLFELKDATLYSVAYNSKQASIVLDGVISIYKKSKKIRQLMELDKIKCFSSPYRREIKNLITDSKYIALADNINANDGLIGNLLVVDEIHRMKNALYDVCAGMTNNMPNSLEVIISTAGSGDKSHRSYQKYEYAKKVQRGEIIDVSLLPVIYECTIPVTPANIYEIDTLLTCNPVLVEDESRRAKAAEDITEAKQLRNDYWWKRYRLNIWCATDGDEYVMPEAYEECEVEPIAEEKLKYCDCYIGIDKGGVWDFSAITFLFKLEDGRVYEKHYAFAVADRLYDMEYKDDIKYKPYIERGELLVIPGDAVADEWLTDWLLKKIEGYNVKSVAADPHQTAYIVETLASKYYDVFNVQQSNNRLLTPVIENYAERIRQKTIVHAPNALYEWQLKNCRIYSTSKDTMKIVKAGSNTKGKGGLGHIDSIDAVITALSVLRAKEIDEISSGAGGIVIG